MRKTFIFHRDRLQYMEEMSPAEKLQLYEAITAYNLGQPVEIGTSLKFIRSRIKKEMDHYHDQYDRIVERNSINGKKGGRPRKDGSTTGQKPQKPTGLLQNPKNPSEPKKAERDNHNHIDYDNHILNKNKEDNILNTKELKEKEKIKKEKEKNSFEEFWGVYPNKQKKIKAKEKYDALLKNGTVSHTVLMEGVMKYVAHIRKNNIEPKFIKQPTTRLNNGCWEDEYKITLARPPVVGKSPPPQPTAPVVSALTPTNETDKEKAKKVLSQWRANIKTL